VSWRNVRGARRTEVCEKEEGQQELRTVQKRTAVSSVVLGASGLCLRREGWRFRRSPERIGSP
jgi:hypothetical protein